MRYETLKSGNLAVVPETPEDRARIREHWGADAKFHLRPRVEFTPAAVGPGNARPVPDWAAEGGYADV